MMPAHSVTLTVRSGSVAAPGSSRDCAAPRHDSSVVLATGRRGGVRGAPRSGGAEKVQVDEMGAGDDDVAADEAKAAAWTTQWRRDVDDAFARIDANCDGHLSRAEVIRACRVDARVRSLLGLPHRIRQEDGSRDAFEAVFQRLDADDSKAVSLREFRRVFASPEQFRQRRRELRMHRDASGDSGSGSSPSCMQAHSGDARPTTVKTQADPKRGDAAACVAHAVSSSSPGRAACTTPPTDRGRAANAEVERRLSMACKGRATDAAQTERRTSSANTNPTREAKGGAADSEIERRLSAMLR